MYMYKPVSIYMLSGLTLKKLISPHSALNRSRLIPTINRSHAF